MRADPVTLASGAVTAALGALVLVDSSGALHVPLGWMAVALTAAVGAILVVSGLAGSARERED
jgi:peptidoglycan/LPS O-acetylase OafA/YrhL